MRTRALLPLLLALHPGCGGSATESLPGSDLAAGPRSKSYAWMFVVVGGAALSIGLFFIGRYTAIGRNPEEGGRRSDASSPSALTCARVARVGRDRTRRRCCTSAPRYPRRRFVLMVDGGADQALD